MLHLCHKQFKVLQRSLYQLAKIQVSKVSSVACSPVSEVVLDPPRHLAEVHCPRMVLSHTMGNLEICRECKESAPNKDANRNESRTKTSSTVTVSMDGEHQASAAANDQSTHILGTITITRLIISKFYTIYSWQLILMFIVITIIITTISQTMSLQYQILP